MPPENFICKRCGHCCIDFAGGYTFSVFDDQVEKWAEEAPHILEWISDLGYGLYDGWISPHTGEDVFRCPWLRIRKHERFKVKGAHCLIHAHKPPVCLDYPKDVAHAVWSGCQGFSHLPEKVLLGLLRGQLITVLKLIAELSPDKRREPLQSKSEQAINDLRFFLEGNES